MAVRRHIGGDWKESCDERVIIGERRVVVSSRWNYRVRRQQQQQQRQKVAAVRPAGYVRQCDTHRPLIRAVPSGHLQDGDLYREQPTSVRERGGAVESVKRANLHNAYKHPTDWSLLAS